MAYRSSTPEVGVPWGSSSNGGEKKSPGGGLEGFPSFRAAVPLPPGTGIGLVPTL